MINNRIQLNTISVALTVGSLWGAIESTLGYVLHRAHVPGLAGAMLFPVGIYFMALALKRSKSGSAIMMTAIVAAVWKGLSALFPGGMLNIVNPMQAILFEGLVVSVVFKAIDITIPQWVRAEAATPQSRNYL